MTFSSVVVREGIQFNFRLRVENCVAVMPGWRHAAGLLLLQCYLRNPVIANDIHSKAVRKRADWDMMQGEEIY